MERTNIRNNSAQDKQDLELETNWKQEMEKKEAKQR